MSTRDRSEQSSADGSNRSRSTGSTHGDAAPDSADSRWMSVDDIRDVYADQADTMARFSSVNRLVTGRYRGAIFGRASGRVLDVACGLATNREYLPEGVEYVGVDLSPAILERAEASFADLERGENLLEMNAEALEFPDDGFDTVISSLSTCTFPHPVTAVNEMNRVCKPGGRILLLEHGRSSLGPIARFQDWRAETHYEKHGCRWNHEPAEIVEDAEPSIVSTTTRLAGIITMIEAKRTDGGPD